MCVRPLTKLTVYQYQVHSSACKGRGIFFADFYGLKGNRHLSKNYNYEKNNAAAICMCRFYAYNSAKNQS